MNTDTIPGTLRATLGDHYGLERVVGSGGMATVYLAEDVKHRRRVAVKVLRPELSATLGVDRFLKEIEIAAGLTHPHILTLIDSGQIDDILYYVMPYVDGESVRGLLLRERRLSFPAALSIIEKVADALTYAHRMGVVHRDIKPENILLSEGHAVVADFGIAKAISTAGVQHLTRTGFPMGTPGYMSPEQAAGRTDLDSTTDVYSLACVLYEMLVGDTPGLWVSEESARLGRFLDALPAHRKRLDRLPGRVEQALVQAMAMRPANRFASPNEFAEALARATGEHRRYDESEVKAIVGRAASSQASNPTEDAALTMGSVEQIAAEVGISPQRVRDAARGLERDQSDEKKGSWFFGSPMTLTFERTVEGEVPEDEYTVFVEEIRAAFSNVGHVSTLGKSLAWTTANPTPGQGRMAQCTITPRGGRTRIRLEEKIGNLAGGLFGGIWGGAGGSLTPLSVVLTLEASGPVALAVGLGVLALGGTYALARSIFTAVAGKRRRELEQLIDRLTDYAEDVAIRTGRLDNRSPPRQLLR